MLKNGTVIIPSTEFKRNIANYLKDIDSEQEPVFITVNGEGSHTIMHIDVYNELNRYKRYCLTNFIDINQKQTPVE